LAENNKKTRYVSVYGSSVSV